MNMYICVCKYWMGWICIHMYIYMMIFPHPEEMDSLRKTEVVNAVKKNELLGKLLSTTDMSVLILGSFWGRGFYGSGHKPSPGIAALAIEVWQSRLPCDHKCKGWIQSKDPWLQSHSSSSWQRLCSWCVMRIKQSTSAADQRKESCW